MYMITDLFFKYTLVLLLFSKINFANKHKSLLFSLFKIYISFSAGVKEEKFGLISGIVSINSVVIFWTHKQKLLFVFNLLYITFRTRGTPHCRPFSILHWCVEMRSLVILIVIMWWLCSFHSCFWRWNKFLVCLLFLAVHFLY